MLNLHRALGFHPALRDKLARGEMGKLLVGYDTRNRDTALRAFSALPNLSAFLWARRLNSALSARLRESLAKQDSKLVHR